MHIIIFLIYGHLKRNGRIQKQISYIRQHTDRKDTEEALVLGPMTFRRNAKEGEGPVRDKHFDIHHQRDIAAILMRWRTASLCSRQTHVNVLASAEWLLMNGE